MLTTTEQGLLRSADGGRTWTSILGAPRLAVLAWEEVLMGVGTDGVVYRSTNTGRTRIPAGDGAGEDAAAVDRDVQRLDTSLGRQGDRLGTTFTPRYAE